MAMRLYTYLLFIVLLQACASEKSTGQKYLRWVGDIENDAALDDASFDLCHGENNVKQYFNTSQGMKFEGEKISLDRYFHERYTPIAVQESGWVRIRFIINCQGKTGRFRLMQADENYKERNFDKRISDQLLALTKSLKGWEIQILDGESIDYYQYLTFKINRGNIEKILP